MSTYCRSYCVSSLEEYLAIVTLQSQRRSGGLRRMWYRGHSKQNWLLLPTLLRGGGGTNSGRYGRDHLREDLRYQHFRSKCNQLVDTNPESRIEWQEIFQHHGGATRLMDWSESAVTALMFALEAFIDPRQTHELDYLRLNMTPVVWAVDPSALNRHVYESLRARPDLMAAALRDLLPRARAASLGRRMQDVLSGGEARFFLSGEGGEDRGIFCLSVIDSERRACGGRLLRLLENGEFNPFFYLLLRFYADGLSVPMDSLPPLAIVHPYHSRRIQNQHGVFTVMPHYQIDAQSAGGPDDRRPMELQPLLRDCLCQIRIARPGKVARELLAAGERRADIYPELDVYVRDIESGQWRF